MWVVPGKFVFSHFPRTGGTFFRENVESQTKVIDVLPHGKISDIPEEFKDLQIVTIVREPSSWIQSLFRYRKHHSGWHSEKDVLDRCTDNSVDVYMGNIIRNHHGICSDFEEGFTAGADFIIKYEHLMSESENLLSQFGLELPIRDNVNGTNSYQEYAQKETGDAFNCDNMTFCERYGYEIPDGVQFSFSKDYSGWLKDTIRKYCIPRLRGRPVHVLEIGVCEGGGAVSFFDELLHHPCSTYTGHDIWVMNPRYRAERNISFVSEGKHRLLDSRLRVRDRKYDVVHVDGAHDYANCTNDTTLAWDVIGPGGIVIWDDYGGKDIPTECPEVKVSVDEFLASKPGRFQRLSNDNDYQMTVQKVAS